MTRLFWQGMIVNVLNPKTALFFLAFLPQFVDPDAGPVAPQMLVLGTLLVALGVLSDGTYAVVAAGAGPAAARAAAARRTARPPERRRLHRPRPGRRPGGGAAAEGSLVTRGRRRTRRRI